MTTPTSYLSNTDASDVLRSQTGSHPSTQTSSNIVCGLTGDNGSPVIFKYKTKLHVDRKGQTNIVGFSRDIFERRFHKQSLFLDSNNGYELFKRLNIVLVPVKQIVHNGKLQVVTSYKPVLMGSPHVILNNHVRQQSDDSTNQLTNDISSSNTNHPEPIEIDDELPPGTIVIQPID